MVIYKLEIAPIATAQLTGQLGTLIATFRGREYRVMLGGYNHTKDGKPIDLMEIPKPVYRQALKWYNNLVAEYKRRTA